MVTTTSAPRAQQNQAFIGFAPNAKRGEFKCSDLRFQPTIPLSSSALLVENLMHQEDSHLQLPSVNRITGFM